MRASVVSIFPFDSREEKPGIMPASFIIPGCKDINKPVIVLVDDAMAHEWIDITRGVRVHEIAAADIAKSICNDKRSAMFGSNADREAWPGLAWFDVEVSAIDLKLKYSDVIDKIKHEQENWMKYLVQLADDDWARYHQHKFINDLQRWACGELGLSRDWSVVYEDSSLQCPSCFTYIHPKSVVCRNCRVVLKPDEYKKFTMASA